MALSLGEWPLLQSLIQVTSKLRDITWPGKLVSAAQPQVWGPPPSSPKRAVTLPFEEERQQAVSFPRGPATRSAARLMWLRSRLALGAGIQTVFCPESGCRLAHQPELDGWPGPVPPRGPAAPELAFCTPVGCCEAKGGRLLGAVLVLLMQILSAAISKLLPEAQLQSAEPQAGCQVLPTWGCPTKRPSRVSHSSD